MLSEQGFWQEKLTAQQMALAQLEQQNQALEARLKRLEAALEATK